jgi:phage terminase large subunit GpA-like protein
MMAVAPTVELAKRNSTQRLDPLIEESEVLRERVKELRSRDRGNTVLSKEFPGGVLILTGANSAVGLRSMPARYLFLDEVDGYPGDVEGEGDPILLAERRSATFQRRKILLVSTPKTKGRSRKAEYACCHCGSLIGERHKTWTLEHVEWRPTADGDGRTAGFHLSSLYSPVGWFSWADAAEMYEQVRKAPDLMKGFVNMVLGLPFEEEAEGGGPWSEPPGTQRKRRWSLAAASSRRISLDRTGAKILSTTGRAKAKGEPKAWAKARRRSSRSPASRWSPWSARRRRTCASRSP